jgi:hypothetical protein
MAPAERPHVRRRLRLAITGAVVLTALTVATAGASAPNTRPRTPVPGFLLDRGRATGFDAAGARMQTGPLGIDDRRRIVGNYIDAGGAYHGFLRDERGRFTTIDFPGALATQPETSNHRGQIVGSYSTTAAQLQAPKRQTTRLPAGAGQVHQSQVAGAWSACGQ